MAGQLKTDGVVLMYMKDGVLYPVGMTEEEWNMVQITARVMQPLKVMFDQPQGKAVNLIHSPKGVK